jgi:hypothetical protein
MLGEESLKTTQMAALRFGKHTVYDIFIHESDRTVALVNNGHGWDCEYTDKDIRYTHNLLVLWEGGEFDAYWDSQRHGFVEGWDPERREYGGTRGDDE